MQTEVSDSTPHSRQSLHGLTWRLGVAAAVRLLFNTAIRFAYPYAPVLGRGLGVPAEAVSSLLAANQLAGIFGLISGPMSDRWGRRRMMLAGSVILGGGMLLGGALPVYGGVLLALVLAGLGKSLYDPALQAMVGEQVPYKRRGQAVGLMEFAWAGSLFLGIPLIGLLIDRYGWRSPFLLLGVLGLFSAAVVMLLFPREQHERQNTGVAIGFRQAWRRLSREPAALFALAFAFLSGAASLNLFSVYGVWMEDAFGLSVVALGTSSLTIGLGELAGEGLTAVAADRLGLKRAVIVGSVLVILSYAVLPWLGQSLSGALLGLFITFMCFEFTIVTYLSLATEILPGARATMMAGHMATSSLGRVVGAAVGGLVWMAGGPTASGYVSAIIASSALVCIVLGLRAWRSTP